MSGLEMSAAEVYDALADVQDARTRGAPYTWRNANTLHRRMLTCERLGLVKRLKVTRAQVFWGLTDLGDAYIAT